MKFTEHRVPIIPNFISQPRQTVQTACLNHHTLASCGFVELFWLSNRLADVVFGQSFFFLCVCF